MGDEEYGRQERGNRSLVGIIASVVAMSDLGGSFFRCFVEEIISGHSSISLVGRYCWVATVRWGGEESIWVDGKERRVEE